MKKQYPRLATLFAATLTLSALAADRPPTAADYTLTNTWEIGGEGGWDPWSAAAITLDDAGKLLYIPRVAYVQVIDVATGKETARIPAREGRAVALVPDAGRGFITSRQTKDVTVFDLKTLAVLGKIPVNDAADAIIYDSMSKKMLVSCSTEIVVFSPGVDLKAVATDPPIKFDGSPRGMVSDGLGMVYVVTNRDDVAVLDTRRMTLATRFEIPMWRGAHSIALDPKRSRLFVGGRAKVTILSAVDGHLLGDVDVGTPNVSVGVGGIAFHNGEAFATCGEGSVGIIGQKEEGTFFLKSKIQVPTGTRALALDAKSGAIYLPFVEVSREQARRGTPMKVAVVEKK